MHTFYLHEKMKQKQKIKIWLHLAYILIDGDENKHNEYRIIFKTKV